MYLSLLVACLLVSIGGVALAEEAPAQDSRCYELRVYTAAPDKLDALNTRFREHTCKLFEKHGMTNIGYWVPLENPERKLYYILAYPNRAERDKSWKAFLADPEWRAAAAASEKGGKLVSKVESTFLHTIDYSPAIEPGVSRAPRIFELRTYTCTPKNLERLNSRFRDHTVSLFSKHGMHHFGYWVLDAKQPGVDDTLVYLLWHDSQAARDASFDAFRADPEWQKVLSESEQAAGGSLTAKEGVQSVLLTPTDYSPTK